MGREDAAAMSDTSSGRRGGRGRRRVEVGTQRRTQDAGRGSSFWLLSTSRKSFRRESEREAKDGPKQHWSGQ